MRESIQRSMQPIKHNRFRLIALCMAVTLAWVACLPVKAAEAMATAPPTDWKFPVTRMQALNPSPEQVLTAPPSVTGDFAIAKTPPVIDFGLLPGQWPHAYCWSNWGGSLFASDGNFYCSIGQHGSPRGYAYVYQVNPATRDMKMVVDVTAELKQPAEDYAPGKVHGPLLEHEGAIYFIGYRGSGAGLNDEHHYKGDPMLRYELASGTVAVLPAPAAYYSVPSAAVFAPTKMLYGLGAGGAVRTPNSAFFAYDLEKNKTVFLGGPAPDECRAILVAPDGRVYYSTGNQAAKKGQKGQADVPAKPGMLARYDPKTNQVTVTDLKVPDNGSMRAASRCNAQGVAYAITHDGVIFSFDTKTEKMAVLGKTFETGPGYTAICKLSPDERFLYFVPGAHGGATVAGCPVMQMDTRTGKRKVIAFLHPYMEKQMNYHTGGTFGIDISPDGATLGICFNGKKLDEQISHGSSENFDQCAVMLVHIPESER